MNRLFSLNRHRSLIRCSGKETSQFLQGQITNDMQLLIEQGSCIYTLFLNKLGRILYDSIIYKHPQKITTDKEEFLIECDTEVVNNLVKNLKLYRVRRKIDISLSEEYDLWCFLSSNNQHISSTDKIFMYDDPRLKGIGARVITQKDDSNLKTILKDVTIGNYNDYTTHRYQLGVGEGVIDFPPEKSFPLEANCDYMNGVSF
jgi:transferase CAF17, mitochondrial